MFRLQGIKLISPTESRSYVLFHWIAILGVALVVPGCSSDSSREGMLVQEHSSDDSARNREGYALWGGLLRPVPRFAENGAVVGGLPCEQDLLHYIRDRRDVLLGSCDDDMASVHYTCFVLGTKQAVSSYGILPSRTDDTSVSGSYLLIVQFDAEPTNVVIVEEVVLPARGTLMNVYGVAYKGGKWRTQAARWDVSRIGVADNWYLFDEPDS